MILDGFPWDCYDNRCTQSINECILFGCKKARTMKSYQELIQEKIDVAIDDLKAAKINPHNAIENMKAARRALKAAIALEESL